MVEQVSSEQPNKIQPDLGNTGKRCWFENLNEKISKMINDDICSPIYQFSSLWHRPTRNTSLLPPPHRGEGGLNSDRLAGFTNNHEKLRVP